MACADAALVCRDYIRNTYPRKYAEIMANKFQQLEEDDSSNESTETEHAENEGLNNRTTAQKVGLSCPVEGRPKYKGKVKNSTKQDMSDPPARLINACVCGRPLWAAPKTCMITLVWIMICSLIVRARGRKWLSFMSRTNKGPPPPTRKT